MDTTQAPPETTALTGVAPPIRLAEHRIYACFTFVPPQGAEKQLTLGALPQLPRRSGFLAVLFGARRSAAAYEKRTPARWIPECNRAALAGRYAHEHVWKEAILGEGDKLLEPVDALLAGRVPAKARRFCLTEHAKDLLREAKLHPELMPGSEHQYHEMVALLRPAASKRISAALGPSALKGIRLPGATNENESSALQVTVHDVVLYRFGTGVAVAVAEIEGARFDKQALSGVELEELVAAIGHVNQFRWRIRRGPGAPALAAGEPFDFVEVVHSLVEGSGSVGRNFRTFTQAFARVDAAPCTSAVDNLAVRLARQHTQDHAARQSAARLERVQDYDNVVHMVAREGAATVVVSSSGAPFLVEFRTQTFDKTYLPLAVLNLHELAESLDIRSRAAVWPRTGVGENEPRRRSQRRLHAREVERSMAEALSGLEQVRDRALRLRLAYRFATVSRIGTHDGIHHAFRNVFSLARLEDELTRDVTEINGYLRSLLQGRVQNNFRHWSASAYAIAYAFAAFLIVRRGGSWLAGFEELADILGFAAGVITFFAARQYHLARSRVSLEADDLLAEVLTKTSEVGGAPRASQ